MLHTIKFLVIIYASVSYKSTLHINPARRRILSDRFCFAGIITRLCIQREKPLVNYGFAHSLQCRCTYKHITLHIRVVQSVTCFVFKNDLRFGWNVLL